MLKSQNAYTDNAWQTVGLGFADVSYTRTGWLGVGGNGTDICDFWLANDKGDVSLRPGINGKAKVADTEIATVTPPEEYDLPLVDGITAVQPCTYYKNQFSEVTLGGCTSGSVSDGATIATLPEGFRPDHPIERPATFTANGNRYAGSVFITANGIVSIHTPAEATNVVFAASFLAKN